jgi:hypothetical protein
MNVGSYGGALKVDLAEIDRELRPASLMRVQLSEEAVETYAENLDSLPPVCLVYDRESRTHWLADGCHTIHAARNRGRAEIRAVVRQGGYFDAFHDACRANDSHGVRVTNADKRRRVEEALKHEEMKGKSARHIADLCGVSPDTVCRIKPDAQVSDSDTSTVVGKDGKTYPAKPRKPKQPRKEPFVCHQCGEEFDHPVWHCPGCAEHWPNTENTCPNCPLAHDHAGDEPQPNGSEPAGAADEDEDGDAGEADDPPVEAAPFDEARAWSAFRKQVRAEFDRWPDDAKAFFAEKLGDLYHEIGYASPGYQFPRTEILAS